jgi:hypothetical protein
MKNYTLNPQKTLDSAKTFEDLNFTENEIKQLSKIASTNKDLYDFGVELLLTKKKGFEFKNLLGAAYKKSLVSFDKGGMTNVSFESNGKRFNLSAVDSLDQALTDQDDSLTLVDVLGSADPLETYAATQTISASLSEVCDLLAQGTAAVQALPLSLTTNKKVGVRQAQKLIKAQIDRAAANKDLFFDLGGSHV